LERILVARNRYEEPASLAADPETHHEEFVTDRERVRQLLRENGGRMKQSSIVDSVDWSKAKVSRLLADLEEDEQIHETASRTGEPGLSAGSRTDGVEITRTGERRLVTVHSDGGARAACGVPILVTGTERNGTDRRPFLSAIVVFRERTRH